MTRALPILACLAVLALSPGAHAEDATPDTTWSEVYRQRPLLPWDTLIQTVYDPRRVIDWPADVLAADETRVRMEGYLMPRYHAQEPGDLFLVGLNPTSFFCGPSDLTRVVEVHMDDFRYDTWPLLPVEITGTFHLSHRPGSYYPIYILLAEDWRPRTRWAQDFPGAEVDEDGEGETLLDLPN